MNKNASPKIEEIKLSELEIDIELSGRTQKEIDKNAKALAPVLSAFGAWDASQPGQYFVRDKKKHLLRGFTRVAAAKLNGLKVGYFVEVDDKPEENRFDCITSNVGQPLTPYAQGKKFAEARDGSDPEKLAVGEVAMPPMTTKEIAAITGKSEQWVKDCIVVYESPAEIGELVLNGELSANVVVRARQIAKDDAKLAKIVKAVVAESKRDFKEVATMKHFDAIKSQFVELKPAKKTDAHVEPPKETGKSEKKETPAPPQSASDLESRETPAPQSEPDKPEKKSGDLFQQPELAEKAPTKSAKKKLRDEYAVILNAWSEKCEVVFSDEDLEALLDDLEAVKLPF